MSLKIKFLESSEGNWIKLLLYFGGHSYILQVEEEHEEHLRIALQLLRENQPYEKLSKCSFLPRTKSMSGTYHSRRRTTVNPGKIEPPRSRLL